MSNNPLSDDLALEAVEALQKYGDKSAASRALNLSRSTYVHRLARAAARGLDGSLPRPLPPGQIVKGVSTLYNEAREEVLTWVKTGAENATQDFMEAAREFFETYRGHSIPPPAPIATNEDLLAVYPIADHHLGMYAWGRETGADYDLDTSRQILLESMGALVSSSPPASTGVVLNLGDFFHADSSANATPASGHVLDVDSRYMKVMQTGVALLVATVEQALQQHERVIVRSIPGNHDPHASIALTIALDAFFSNNDRVDVDTTPGEFWFHRFGKVLLGAHHGHRAKPTQLALAMSALHPKWWGDTKHRHFFTGHIHHRSAQEVGAVEWESFQTLAPKDAWSAGNAFTSSRGMKALIFDRDKGEIARNSVRLG